MFCKYYVLSIFKIRYSESNTEVVAGPALPEIIYYFNQVHV